MNIFEDTNPRSLKELLNLIHSTDMALPDFQRSFVWDPSATQELIVSISSNYPAGSILRVKNSNTLFAVREFEGAPVLNGRKPIYLILDGQQRLTSLYQAFYGKGEHKFFIDLNYLKDGKDFSDAVFHLRASKADKKFGTLAKQARSWILPLEIIYGNPKGFYGWMDSLLDELDLPKEEYVQRRDELRAIYKSWIEVIEHYEFPVVTLSDKTTADAVCTIFETLNRTGVKLSVFELLTARFWTEDINLRQLLENAKEEYGFIDDFDIDPYYILQSVSMLDLERAPSCKRKDLLEMESKLIKNEWENVIKGFDGILKILVEDCGVFIPDWLPYNTIVIPMAAVWAKQKAVGTKIGANRKKLTQWFWCSVFSQAYENSPNSQAAKDFVELNRWMEGGEEPETISRFSFDIDQLRETTPRQRAVYRGIICLILRNSPIDFYEAKKITSDLLKERCVDDHHIFPDAYLQELKTEKTLRNCILNRTLIDRATNQRIGKRPPSKYLKDIQEQIGSQTLHKVITSHLIAKDLESLKKDSFEEFIEYRLEILRRNIQEVTGKTIHASDAVLERS